MDIVAMAKAFLPANSPWHERINQAQQIAGQFQPTKAGVLDLMRQHGKGTEDIKKALAAMQNPMISGMLNRVSPNLVQQLQQAGQDILNTPGVNTPAPSSPAHPQSTDTVQELKQRLGALSRR